MMRQPKTESSKSIIYKRRMSSCTHCGIKWNGLKDLLRISEADLKATPQWRPGPDYKPLLCDACWSRWNIHNTLNGYIPRHGLAKGYRQEVTQGDRLKGDTVKTGSVDSPSDKEDSGIWQPRCWGSDVPRKKRSVLHQYVRTTLGTLQRRLRRMIQLPEFNYLLEEEEVLIFENINNQIAPGEIGAGCMLL